MRTSLNEIKDIEEYIFHLQAPGERLLMDAKAQLDKEFALKVQSQQSAYSLIRNYGREQVKAEIAHVQDQLFTQSKYRRFKESMLNLFSPKS
ncbi:hypothetical protein [Echinicola shivajiensis]|uniref:hypothetical protein n=1 Tax=Echinicola shivajiensis TaxID=1035916 RepID=UPI001BFBFAC5|nr:hypothetical protein [Echinicola shivajiensis]